MELAYTAADLLVTDTCLAIFGAPGGEDYTESMVLKTAFERAQLYKDKEAMQELYDRQHVYLRMICAFKGRLCRA